MQIYLILYIPHWKIMRIRVNNIFTKALYENYGEIDDSKVKKISLYNVNIYDCF